MPKGFVRENEESNAKYLAEWKDDPWWPFIEKADAGLKAIDPDYMITQIKTKFGELRYYYSSKFDWNSDEGKAMREVTRTAEREVDGFEEAGV